MAVGSTFIGTSGWHYDHWAGPFYPPGVERKRWLDFYAQHFQTAEINNTFYQLPTERAVDDWRRQTPSGFVFACKASRYITHMKKLKDPAASVPRFFDALQPLGRKRGPTLFQLPPHWRVDLQRMTDFLEASPVAGRCVFEFREESWWTREVYDILSQHNAAFCEYDLNGKRSPSVTTADFHYVRLHGPDGAYRGQYDGRTLAGWARRFEKWLANGHDVYCYFDNDQAGYAPQDALRLKEMLEGS